MRIFLSVCSLALLATVAQPRAARGADLSQYSLSDYQLSVSPDQESSSDKSVYGVVNYTGGFVEKAAVALAAPARMSEFTVQIPAFCTGVEILEAGFTHQRGQTRSSLVTGSTNRFTVPSQVTVTGLWVTLNGPAATACTIPLISGSGPTPPPTPTLPIDGNFAGTRGVQMSIAGGIVTRHNLILQNPNNGVASAINFSTGFRADAFNPSNFTAQAWSDVLVVTPLNQWAACRIPLGFGLTNALNGTEQFTLSMSWPAAVFIDVWGRCGWNGLRADSAIISRLP